MSLPKEYHIAFGRHSLIPECCIQFWVNVWDPRSEYGELLRSKNHIDKADRYNYVPCPDCFAEGKRVVIRRCARDCRGVCSFWLAARERARLRGDARFLRHMETAVSRG